MKPVNPISKISDKHLWQAEALLQELADRFSKLQTKESKSINNHRLRIINVLHQDKAEQREQSDRMIKQSVKLIDDLTAHYQRLCLERETEICSLTGSEDDKKLTTLQVLEWKKREDDKIDGVQYNCENQLAQFSSDLDDHILQLNHVQAELTASSSELTDLIRTDEKLSRADRSVEIQTEIRSLGRKINTILKKAAGICEEPFNQSFNISNSIADIEAELKQIQNKLEQVSEPLDNPAYQRFIEQPESKAKTKKASELESIVVKIKRTVKEKRTRLGQLYRLRTELIRLSQLEKTARLDLDGEMKRLQKQKDRTLLIEDVKTKQEYRRQNLALIRDKITEIEINIETVRNTQQKIQQRKQFYQQKAEKIETLSSNIDKCSSQLAREQEKLKLMVPASTIWYESIRHRAILVRKLINFGNPFRLLFRPYHCYFRYRLGLLIRKDLIRAERLLLQLGILSEEYIEQIDIFNRKNKKGQQLCLDILAC